MPEPLVHNIALRCSVEHAFAVFTQRVDLWWPPSHRRLENSTLHYDARTGGQLREHAPSGEVFVWADVLHIDPPHEIRIAWHPGKITEPTQTLITFTADGPHGAQVKVVHTEGEAALGDQWSHRAALFNAGWGAVLPAFADFIHQEGTGT